FECELWPSPGGTPLGRGPLPNVPVLEVSGGVDVRTPTANAAAVVQRFPQGHLLVVPGVGHSVLGVDLSFCSLREVRYWVLGLLGASVGRLRRAAVPLLRASAGAIRFDLAVARRGGRHERGKQAARRFGDLVDRSSARLGVGAGRLGEAADLADVLERGGAYL